MNIAVNLGTGYSARHRLHILGPEYHERWPGAQTPGALCGSPWDMRWEEYERTPPMAFCKRCTRAALAKPELLAELIAFKMLNGI